LNLSTIETTATESEERLHTSLSNINKSSNHSSLSSSKSNLPSKFSLSSSYTITKLELKSCNQRHTIQPNSSEMNHCEMTNTKSHDMLPKSNSLSKLDSKNVNSVSKNSYNNVDISKVSDSKEIRDSSAYLFPKIKPSNMKSSHLPLSSKLIARCKSSSTDSSENSNTNNNTGNNNNGNNNSNDNDSNNNNNNSNSNAIKATLVPVMINTEQLSSNSTLINSTNDSMNYALKTALTSTKVGELKTNNLSNNRLKSKKQNLKYCLKLEPIQILLLQTFLLYLVLTSQMGVVKIFP